MTVDVADSGVVTAVPGGHSVPAAVPNPNRIFVDSSGRRAKWVGRLGNLLGLGCAAYVGMVALGLSGTRVAPMTTIPITQDNRIIAGLSGQTGSIGLHLTETPYVAPPVATVVPVRRTVTPSGSSLVPVRAPSATTTAAKPPASVPTPKPSKPSTSSKPGTPSKPGKSSSGAPKTSDPAKPSPSDISKAE